MSDINSSFRVDDKGILDAKLATIDGVAVEYTSGQLAYMNHHGVEMTTVVEDILEHHGIKGQKWGVRRVNPGGIAGKIGIKKKVKGPASEDAAKAYASRAKGKLSGVQTLSNREIQEFLTRANLESNFSRVTASPSRKAVRWLGGLLTNVGKQQVNTVVNENAKKVKEAFDNR